MPTQTPSAASRLGASKLITQVLIVLLMLGTFGGVFAFLYYSNLPPAQPKVRQILFFTVSHDRSCREMEPTIKRLVNAGLNLTRIDIESDPDLRTKYAVVQVPCTILLEGNKEISRQMGPLTEKELRAKLDGVQN